MKKIQYLLISLLMFTFVLNVKAVEKEAQEESDFRYSYFIKQDEDGNLVPDAKFEQRSLNGNVVIELESFFVEDMPNPPVIIDEENGTVPNTLVSPPGRYKYINSIYNKDMVLNLLTSEQKELLNNIKTYNDFLKYKEALNKDYFTYMCNGKEEAIETLRNNKGIFAYENDGSVTKQLVPNTNLSDNNDELSQVFPKYIDYRIITNMIIEEVQMPKGLQKSYIVVPMEVIMRYKITEDGTLVFDDNYCRAIQYMNLLKYDSSINYNKIEEVINKIDNTYVYETTCAYSKDITYFTYTCNNHLMPGIIISPIIVPNDVTDPSCPFGGATIIDKKGTPSLKISTYVDGKQRLSAKKDTTAIISVKLENNGTAGSYNNKIVSRVPKNLVYVDDKEINKYGVYNREDGTVTWNLEYLDSLDAAMFSYKVSIPATADISMLYTSTATVESMDTSTPIVSDAAEIDLADVVNPKTGDTRALYIFTSLIIAITVLLVVNKKSIMG